MDSRIAVGAAVIQRGGRVLLGRRPPGKRHGGLWEFPGGKLVGAETLRQAIARELLEELDLRFRRIGSVLYRTGDPGSPFDISFVEVQASGTPRALEHTEVGWFEPASLREMELAPADRRFVAAWLDGEEGPLTGR
jgi:8-oxo-dGTP diphosphatase